MDFIFHYLLHLLFFYTYFFILRGKPQKHELLGVGWYGRGFFI